jgi:Leucine-rich repeat (LRR) protein
MHRLAYLTELNLSHNNLSTFPSFASEIQLEILDLSFNSLEEVISTKDLHLLYYNTILSYPDISNFQRQEFEMNTHLSEVAMITFVDFFHLSTGNTGFIFQLYNIL